jgi:hypothetical protein
MARVIAFCSRAPQPGHEPERLVVVGERLGVTAELAQELRPVEAHLPGTRLALQDQGERVERLLVALQIGRDRAPENQGRGVIGTNADGRVRGLQRLVVPAQEVQLKGDLVPDIGHRRVERDRLTERVQRRRVPAELGQPPAAQVMGHRVLRRDRDGPVRRCQGPRVIPRLRTVQRLLAVLFRVTAT